MRNNEIRWPTLLAIVALPAIFAVGALGDGPSSKEASESQPKSVANALPKGVLCELGSPQFRANGAIQSLVFSPDNRFILGLSGASEVCMWNADTGQVTRRISLSLGGLTELGFSADGRQVHCDSGVNSNQPMRYEWTYPDWKALSTGMWLDNAIRPGPMFNESPRKKISVSKMNEVLVLDPATKRVLLTVPPIDERMTPEISPQGKLLVVASQSKDGKNPRLSVWGLASQRVLQQWTTDGYVGFNWVLAAEETMLIAGSLHHDYVCWELATGREICRIHPEGGSIAPPAATPDGKWLLVPEPDQFSVFEVPSGKLRWKFSFPGELTRFVASSDSKRIAAWGTGPTFAVWDLETGRQAAPLIGHALPIQDLAISDDGKRLLSLEQGRELIRWDLTQRTAEWNVPLPEPTFKIAVSGDLAKIVAGRRDACPWVWMSSAGEKPLRDYQARAGTPRRGPFSQRHSAGRKTQRRPVGVRLIRGPDAAKACLPRPS